jgi:hypothetical protein
MSKNKFDPKENEKHIQSLSIDKMTEEDARIKLQEIIEQISKDQK